MSENDTEVEEEQSQPEWAAQYKHPVIRATENPTMDNIETLTKGQCVFALCELAGIEPPEGNPDNHNGNLSRTKMRELIYAIAQLQEGEEVDENEVAEAIAEMDSENGDEETEA